MEETDGEATKERVIKINSERDPNIQYEINLDTKECTCPHYQNRLKKQNLSDGGDRTCKHYDTAVRLMNES